MNRLLPGFESPKRMALLLSFTRVKSRELVEALTLHYTTALPAERAAARCGIELPNLMRGQVRLEKIAAIVEEIKELDWQRIRNQYQTQLDSQSARITELEQLVSRAANYLYGIGMNEELEQELSAALAPKNKDNA